MTENHDTDVVLRQEFHRQAPRFDLAASLPTRVSVLVRRRRRQRLAITVGALAAVIAAVAIPLGNLRSSTSPKPIVPTHRPTTTSTGLPAPNGPSPELAYVIDAEADGELIPVNLTLSTPEAPIALSLPSASVLPSATADQINDVAVAPDGRTAYVAVGIGPGAVKHDSELIPVDLVSQTAERPIALPGVDADSVVIAPDGRTAFVTSYHAPEVVPVDLRTDTTERAIPLTGIGVDAMAIAPGGRTGYVTGVRLGGLEGRDVLVPVDLATDRAGHPISMPANSDHALALSPDGTTAYVVRDDDPDSGVVPVDLATGKPEQPIVIPGAVVPTAIAIGPGGATAYLTLDSLTNNSGTSDIVDCQVAVIDLRTKEPGRTIGTPDCGSIAVSAAGQVYVVGGRTGTSANIATVTPINGGTGTLGPPIEVPTGPDENLGQIAIAVAPEVSRP